MEGPAILISLGLRGFLGCGASIAKFGDVLDILGWLVIPDPGLQQRLYTAPAEFSPLTYPWNRNTAVKLMAGLQIIGRDCEDNLDPDKGETRSNEFTST